MKFTNNIKIIIKFGPNLQDELVLEPTKAEIRFDENSFQIRGLFKDDKILIEGNPDGTTT